MAQRKRLGDYLIEAGIIDQFQLQSALGHQRQWGGKLGRILVENRFVKEEVMVRALSELLRIDAVELSLMTVHPRVVELLPVDMAERFGMVPVALKREKTGEHLYVAMSDPTNLEAIDEVQFKTGKKVRAMIAGDSAIDRAIRQYYYGEVPREVTTAPPAQVQFSGRELAMGTNGALAPASQPPATPARSPAQPAPAGGHVAVPLAPAAADDDDIPLITGTPAGPSSSDDWFLPGAPSPGAAPVGSPAPAAIAAAAPPGPQIRPAATAPAGVPGLPRQSPAVQAPRAPVAAVVAAPAVAGRAAPTSGALFGPAGTFLGVDDLELVPATPVVTGAPSAPVASAVPALTQAPTPAPAPAAGDWWSEPVVAAAAAPTATATTPEDTNPLIIGTEQRSDAAAPLEDLFATAPVSAPVTSTVEETFDPAAMSTEVLEQLQHVVTPVLPPRQHTAGAALSAEVMAAASGLHAFDLEQGDEEPLELDLGVTAPGGAPAPAIDPAAFDLREIALAALDPGSEPVGLADGAALSPAADRAGIPAAALAASGLAEFDLGGDVEDPPLEVGRARAIAPTALASRPDDALFAPAPLTPIATPVEPARENPVSPSAVARPGVTAPATGQPSAQAVATFSFEQLERPPLDAVAVGSEAFDGAMVAPGPAPAAPEVAATPLVPARAPEAVTPSSFIPPIATGPGAATGLEFDDLDFTLDAAKTPPEPAAPEPASPVQDPGLTDQDTALIATHTPVPPAEPALASETPTSWPLVEPAGSLPPQALSSPVPVGPAAAPLEPPSTDRTPLESPAPHLAGSDPLVDALAELGEGAPPGALPAPIVAGPATMSAAQSAVASTEAAIGPLEPAAATAATAATAIADVITDPERGDLEDFTDAPEPPTLDGVTEHLGALSDEAALPRAEVSAAADDAAGARTIPTPGDDTRPPVPASLEPDTTLSALGLELAPPQQELEEDMTEHEPPTSRQHAQIAEAGSATPAPGPTDAALDAPPLVNPGTDLAQGAFDPANWSLDAFLAPEPLHVPPPGDPEQGVAPAAADLDDNGILNIVEALAPGLALGVDAPPLEPAGETAPSVLPPPPDFTGAPADALHELALPRALAVLEAADSVPGAEPDASLAAVEIEPPEAPAATSEPSAMDGRLLEPAPPSSASDEPPPLQANLRVDTAAPTTLLTESSGSFEDLDLLVVAPPPAVAPGEPVTLFADADPIVELAPPAETPSGPATHFADADLIDESAPPAAAPAEMPMPFAEADLLVEPPAAASATTAATPPAPALDQLLDNVDASKVPAVLKLLLDKGLLSLDEVASALAKKKD